MIFSNSKHKDHSTPLPRRATARIAAQAVGDQRKGGRQGGGSVGSFMALLFVSLLLFACANIGTPDGGPYDETPPKVVRTTPHLGSIKTKTRKIVIEFDENVKLDNPSEKVIISPPQINMPEIDATGRRITVELQDTLIPNATYTIDFSDAIQDNNEGNPMGDYAFTFSTGDEVDTMQVSGYVLDASNLEPIKNMLVGLYTVDSIEPLPDSVFMQKPFERVSRTDSRGHFVIKGLANKHYRVFALKDQDQNFYYSQRSEMLAFNHRVFTPSSKPDIRVDTVWHDSIHYDSLVYVPYTHFYPDNLTLLAFNEKVITRNKLKDERLQLEKFTLYFTAPDSVLPTVEGMNFDSNNAFVIEANPTRDTITYWIRDSLIYNKDTLDCVIHFNAHDTLGVLRATTDTISLVSRQSYAKVQKRRLQEWEEYAKEYRKNYMAEHKDSLRAERKSKKKKIEEEDIPIPPMPEVFLEMNIGRTTFSPDQNLDFNFSEPIDTAYISMFSLNEIVDSTTVPREFLLRRHPNKNNAYRLYAEWQPGSSYELLIDTGAFVSIYNHRTEGTKRSVKVKGLDSFSSLFVTIQNVDSNYILQLINGSDKVVKEKRVKDGKVDFYFIDPGTYYLRLFNDRNGDGEWTTGNYIEQLQGEETYYYPGGLFLRAQWDVSQTWNPLLTPIYEQKPLKITKQKPDKSRKQTNRNAEREEKKRKKK